MENIAVSKSSFYRKKIGVWQLLATCLVLPIFFVVRHSTGKEIASGYILLTLLFTTMIVSLIALTRNAKSTFFFAVVTALCIAVLASFAAFSIAATVDYDIVFAFLFVATTALFIAAATKEARSHGIIDSKIDRKTLQLSYGVEFVIILLPMWLAH